MKLWKIYKYRFLIESFLFGSNLQNDTNIIFITRNSLPDAREAFTNSKLCKTLGVVYLSQIKNWDLVKGKSKKSQAILVDSEYHTKLSHYSFAFISKNVSDLFNFTITLLNGQGNKITLQYQKLYHENEALKNRITQLEEELTKYQSKDNEKNNEK